LYVIDGERDGRSQGAEATSLPDFEDWKRDTRGFEAMATGGSWTFNLTGRAVPERILGGRVSGDFFAVLGTPPLLGRALRSEDDRPESPAVAVLGYGLWQRSFGGDPAVLGRTLFLNGVPTTVVGVMPAGFGYPSREQEMWAPLANELTDVPRDARFLYPIARLARGADLRSAQTSLDVVSSRLAAQFPETNKGWGARMVPARDALVGDARPALFVRGAAVSLVFLIACANVSSLVLARASARRREIAIRAAVGASRARLLRQFVAENLVLAVAGGLASVLVSRVGLALLRALAPADVPRLDEAGLPPVVLGFTLAVSLGAGVLLGLAPAFRASGRAAG